MSPHTLRYILRALEAYSEKPPEDKFWIEKALEAAVESVAAIEDLEAQIEDLESDLRSAERRAEDSDREANELRVDLDEAQETIKKLERE